MSDDNEWRRGGLRQRSVDPNRGPFRHDHVLPRLTPDTPRSYATAWVLDGHLYVVSVAWEVGRHRVTGELDSRCFPEAEIWRDDGSTEVVPCDTLDEVLAIANGEPGTRFHGARPARRSELPPEPGAGPVMVVGQPFNRRP